ncbi:MAG TPA: DUF2254 domain-containing protein [Cytophagaceae bacterium]|jgi:uncharacterized membrane protein
MNSLVLTLTEYYKRLIHGVGFIPLLVTIALIMVGIVLSVIEGTHSGEFALQAFVEVRSVETARSILNGILGGMISLTVFGFSMMMLVVNQSSAIYSPKVVDTLINVRSNQYILGIYLGTIIYTLMTMVLLDSENTDHGVPDLNLISNIILSIICIILFVKFISNISNSVRIGPIAERIYLRTKEALADDKRFKYDDDHIIETEHWKAYPALRSGYLQIVKIEKLLATLIKEDMILKVIPLPGSYITARTALFALNKSDLREGLLEDLYCCFITYTGEDILENEFYGFRQLTEIAVKTLSPAINDPGVAKICIDYLGDLLSDWVVEGKKQIITDPRGNPRIILNKYNFKSLLELSFTPIQVYGKKDYTILVALLRTLYDVSLYDESGKLKFAINHQAKAIVEDGEQNINNFLEREILNAQVAQLNGSGYFILPLLKGAKL